jgi:hypothetical protein
MKEVPAWQPPLVPGSMAGNHLPWGAHLLAVAADVETHTSELADRGWRAELVLDTLGPLSV